MDPVQPASPRQAAFWARALPLGDPRKLLGLSFVLAVAIIWVLASFVVQGIEERGAHPAVLTLVANSLFALYLPVYWANLRWRKRHAARAHAAARAQLAAETSALVPTALPRSDEGDTLPSPLGEPEDGPLGHLGQEDSGNGKASVQPPSMPLRQLFRAALIVSCSRPVVGLVARAPSCALPFCLTSTPSLPFSICCAGGAAVVHRPADLQHLAAHDQRHLQHHPLLHLRPLHLPLRGGPAGRGLHALEAGIHPAADCGCVGAS